MKVKPIGKKCIRFLTMGHRMEFYVDESIAQDIVDISKSFNVDAKIVGKSRSFRIKISLNFFSLWPF